MTHYLQAITLVAGLLASAPVQAQEHLQPGTSAATARVELAQYQQFGHWDVNYWYWNGWYWQKITYGSYTTKAEADHQALIFNRTYPGYYAFSEYHY